MADDDERSQGEFERIAARFDADPAVTEGTGFGSNPGLRVGGRIFAMLVRGELVVKLPARRVDDLIEGGNADRFDAGKGRPMREWARVSASRSGEWEALAREAFRFVGGGRARPHRG